MTSTQIWIQSDESARVQVRYWPEGQPEKPQWSPVMQSEASQGYALHIPLALLKPDTHYQYDVFVNNQPLRKGRFKTQRFWQPGKQPPNFSFAAGSCVFINDPDVPSKPLGGEYHIFESIYSKKPDFMLWMGDNMYLLDPDFDSEARMDRKYRLARSLKELSSLLAHTPNYAIWDDHDFGDNDSSRVFPLRESSLKLFKRYWANLTYGTAETPGIFSKFTYGDVDFFLTDNRYHRASFKVQEADKPFFGEAQLRWLKESLTVSKAPFKIIVVGNEVLNTQTPSENYYSHSAEYQSFLTWLAESKIPGIVIMSGDRHHSELLKKNRPGTYPLYELSASPLTSSAYPPYPVEQDLKVRVPKTLVVKRNFALVQVSGPEGKRQLRLEIFDAKGEPQWHYIITQKELEP